MAATKGKKVVKRRKDRKVVEKGAAHIRSSFNNTMVTITDLGFLRRTRIPRFQEVHSVCCADGR